MSGYRESNETMQVPLPSTPPRSVSHFAEVKDWLDSLHLEELWPLFKEKKYTDLKLLTQTGLSPEDLAYIGVASIHRRVLVDDLLVRKSVGGSS